MRLSVTGPVEGFLAAEVTKVKAEGPKGLFCLLPRHVDFASALVPGILAYESLDGIERFIATDEGFLVKRGDEVLVSVRSAVAGAELGELRRAIAGSIEALDEEERRTRDTIARLESDFMRRFGELSGGAGRAGRTAATSRRRSGKGSGGCSGPGTGKGEAACRG